MYGSNIQLGDILLRAKQKTKHRTKITIQNITLTGKIIVTGMIWMVFAIGMQDGNSNDAGTFVIVGIALLICTLYIWRMDQFQLWLKKQRNR